MQVFVRVLRPVPHESVKLPEDSAIRVFATFSDMHNLDSFRYQ